MSENYFCEEKMVQVKDDWYPSYTKKNFLGITKKYVKLIIKLSNNFYNKERNCDLFYVSITAWGNDDFALTIEMKLEEETEAKKLYNIFKTNIYDKIPKKVDKDWFYSHGFYPW